MQGAGGGSCGGTSSSRGARKPQTTYTSANIHSTSQSTRPIMVPGPPPFSEGFQYSTGDSFPPQMCPPFSYQFQPCHPHPSVTPIDNSIPQDPTIPHQQDVPQAETSSSRVTSQASDNAKLYVEPDGDGFYPDPIKVVHSIVHTFESKFDEPWPNWKKVPLNIRELWFGEFQKRYWWHCEHNKVMRKNFEKKGAARLKNILCDARANNRKPDWMTPEVWKGLCKYWDSKEFKDLSNKNTSNRASDRDSVGESLHTGGSIPFTELRRRLAKLLGREPTVAEFFLYSHKTKKPPGDLFGGEFVDNRSKVAYEKFIKNKDEKILEAFNATESTREGIEGDEEEEEPTQDLDELQIWKDSDGLTKSGRMYGFGIFSSTLKESSSCRSTDMSRRDVSFVDTPEFKAAIAEVTSKLEVAQKANEKKEKEIEHLKKKNNRLKRKIDILFEKLYRTLEDCGSEDDSDG